MTTYAMLCRSESVREKAESRAWALGQHAWQIVAIVGALITVVRPVHADLWCTAYYPGYEQSAMPASEVDFGAVTHVIHFSVWPKADGSLNTAVNNLTSANSADLITRAHAAGKKVLFSVSGSTSGGFGGATTDANRGTFITNLCNFMSSRNYDGIDIDWEPLATSDAQQYTNLIKELRLALNAYSPYRMLTVAAATKPSWFAMLQSQIDQINLMTYDLSGPWDGWVTWFNAPVYDGAYRFPSTGGLVPSADGMVNSFVSAGVVPAKLGIGIAFYGRVWSGGTGTPTGGVTAPRQSWTTAPSMDYASFDTIMSTYYQTSLYHWDSPAQAAWLGIDNAGSPNDLFISYDDEHTCQSKVVYARNCGIGGVMIWELGEAYRSSQPAGERDPLLQAVKRALYGPNIWAGAGSNLNWSTPANWDVAVPADGADVRFLSTGGVGSSGTVNNLVDTSRTLNSLWYQCSNAWQVTEIPAGTSLSITGALAGYSILAGYAGPNNNASNYSFAAVRGAGQLVVNNPSGLISVRLGIGSSGGARAAHLNMSGLDSFTADVSRILVGAEGGASTNRPGGVVYLARTNVIRGYSANPVILIGDGAGDQGGGTNSVVNLGDTNVFLFDSGITVGGRRNRAILRFWSTANPVAFFRDLAGTGRQSVWAIGDNSSGADSAVCAGTNDFSGGRVDALVDSVIVGRGQTGSTGSANGSGAGMLLLGAGRLDANSLDVGCQRPGGSAAIGGVRTSGGATVTNLVVNGDVHLGNYDGLAAASATMGTLDIGSTVIIKGNLISGGSALNSVNLTNGHLIACGMIGNDGGANDLPLPKCNLESGSITLDFGTSWNPATPICNVTNLYVSAVTLNIAGGGLSAGVIPLIKVYSGAPTGSGFGGISQGALPPKLSGSLSNSADTLYLVIRGIETQIGSARRLPNGDVGLEGVGLPSTTYRVLAVTNVALPLSSWSQIGTATSLGNGTYRFTDTTAGGYSQRFYRLVYP